MDSRVSLPTVDCGMQDGLTLPTCVRETIWALMALLLCAHRDQKEWFPSTAWVTPLPKEEFRVSCHIAGHHRQYTLSSRGPVVNLGYYKELLLSTTLVIAHPSNRATGLIGELLTSNCCQWTYIEVRAH